MASVILAWARRAPGTDTPPDISDNVDLIWLGNLSAMVAGVDDRQAGVFGTWSLEEATRRFGCRDGLCRISLRTA